jgi:UDP-2,3-diacylglucosamine pyrophosphatase LpxH
MTLVRDGFSTGFAGYGLPGIIEKTWRNVARQRLAHSLASAVPVSFDDTSRIVFFSDLHRGDGGTGDKFLRNRDLFLATLGHYFDDGYTYIEVGDGDELWVNGNFEDIQRAHRPVFDQLQAFNRDARLYLLVGNHDTFNNFQHQQEKDGIPTYQSLLLRHATCDRQILVLHGHQADLTSSRYYALTRLFCRSIWKRLQAHPDVKNYEDAIQDSNRLAEMQRRRYPFTGQGKRIEQRLIEWVADTEQAIICGHTHQPAFPGRISPPYFNSGSCISPGSITGLELKNGELSLVRWFFDRDRHLQRLLLARPRLIEQLPVAQLNGTR